MFRSSKRSTLISGLLHAAVILVVIALSRVPPIPLTSPLARVTPLVFHDVPRYIPAKANRGGGGGGGGETTRASKGQLPRIALRQFTPPTAVIRNYNPQLAMEPTLVGAPQIMAVLPNMPYGDPYGVNGPPSNGRGRNGGIGDGDGGGVGNHNGPGTGDDDGSGINGRAHIIGTVVDPVLLTKVDPEYSDEARQAKLQGVIMLRIEVDAAGHPRNIRVVHGLGLGLDERAVEAVKQWKFKPGTINGKPGVTAALINVTFRLL